MSTAELRQLTHANIEEIAEWIRQHGGATAGLKLTAGGALPSRGIWMGTLSHIEQFRVGDWVIRDEQGRFSRWTQAAQPG